MAKGLSLVAGGGLFAPSGPALSPASGAPPDAPLLGARWSLPAPPSPTLSELFTASPRDSGWAGFLLAQLGADVVLVVGSRNSSNSNRLVEVSQNLGTSSYLIDKAEDIRPEWLNGASTVAVTAGASAPEVLVKDVVEYL